MEDIEVELDRFEQRIETLKRDVVVIKDIQTEIRTISETLVTLASESLYNTKAEVFLSFCYVYIII